MSQIYKLIIVTRQDLTPGYQATQASHSALLFAQEFPQIFKEWSKNSYLALLSVENEQELISLISKLEKSKVKFSVFREPDIQNQITSICIEPSDASRRMTSDLPLMLRDNKFTCEKCTGIGINKYYYEKKGENYENE